MLHWIIHLQLTGIWWFPFHRAINLLNVLPCNSWKASSKKMTDSTFTQQLRYDLSLNHPESSYFVNQPTKTSWWFQPLWKILVKMGIFPNFRAEKQNIWNHHLENYYNKMLPHPKILHKPTLFWWRFPPKRPSSKSHSLRTRSPVKPKECSFLLPGRYDGGYPFSL